MALFGLPKPLSTSSRNPDEELDADATVSAGKEGFRIRRKGKILSRTNFSQPIRLKMREWLQTRSKGCSDSAAVSLFSDDLTRVNMQMCSGVRQREPGNLRWSARWAHE